MRRMNVAMVVVLLTISFCNVVNVGAEARRRAGAPGPLQLDKTHGARDGKQFSVFNIVRFQNGPCAGSTNLNGTCYTPEECGSRGGTSIGSCAGGYGVCCQFSIGCGSQLAENCTYFTSTGGETGTCSARICKSSSSVCQLRLDFNQFVITGPSTTSLSSFKTVAGAPSSDKTAKASTVASQCLTDTFSVTNPNGAAPPVICGQNNGEHMYVDASDSCNDLVFQLGAPGGGAVANRQWSIKATQIDCNSERRAPTGCTQLFTGNTGTVRSYNYNGGQHLANQNQNICVRRERGNCRICWSPSMMGDFMVSSMVAMGSAGTKCCGYGPAGVDTVGFDCVNIPGALKVAGGTKLAFDQFCGRKLGDTAKAAMSATICSDRQPFNLRFITDNFEFDMEAKMVPNLGFSLDYFQTSAGCS